MRRMCLFLLSIALFGCAVQTDTRKILGEGESVEVDFELSAAPDLFDLDQSPRRDQIRVIPLEIDVRPTDRGERFFRLDHLHGGVVLASQTISCSSTSTTTKCVKPAPNGHQLWVSGYSDEKTCGCIPPSVSPTANPFPNKLDVDWATGAGNNNLGAALTSRLNKAPLALGVEFVEGSEVTRIPANLKGYSCVLAYLRFVQERRGADSILLGIIDAGYCGADRGRAASVGAECRFCAVAVIEKSCLDISYIVEHEVAHLLGADHTNAVSHSGHTGGCTGAQEDLMESAVQSCIGPCDPSKIVFCDQTRSELKNNGPAFMNTQTCEGLF